MRCVHICSAHAIKVTHKCVMAKRALARVDEAIQQDMFAEGALNFNEVLRTPMCAGLPRTLSPVLVDAARNDDTVGRIPTLLISCSQA